MPPPRVSLKGEASTCVVGGRTPAPATTWAPSSPPTQETDSPVREPSPDTQVCRKVTMILDGGMLLRVNPCNCLRADRNPNEQDPIYAGGDLSYE